MTLGTSMVLSGLLCELLDAHDDTALLARRHAREPLWDAHLDYLRALQRKAREALATISGQAAT